MKGNTVPLKLIALLANGEFHLASSWVKPGNKPGGY